MHTGGRDGGLLQEPKTGCLLLGVRETGTKAAACTVSRGARWGTGCHLPLSHTSTSEGQGQPQVGSPSGLWGSSWLRAINLVCSENIYFLQVIFIIGQHSDTQRPSTIGNLHDPPAQPRCVHGAPGQESDPSSRTSQLTGLTMVHAPAFSF